MAGNLTDLVQMIATLSGIQDRRRALDQQDEQIRQSAAQFAQTGEEAKFASALKLIAGSSAKTRQGLQSLLNTLSPEHRDAAQAVLSGQPIDPSVLHAEDIQAGRGAMAPGQLATVQNESAVQNATGMNVGQLGGSQLGGALALGALPQLTAEDARNYAERAATGRDPATAAVQSAQISGGMIPAIAQIAGGLRQTAGQAAQTALGYAGVNFNYAQLDQREREMAAQYGLDKILKTAEAQHYLTGGKAGGLTGPQWVEAMGKMTNILNDINKPSSDKAGNLARIRIFNSMNEALGSPLPPIPLQGEGAPGKVSALTQLYRGVVGGPKVSDYTTQPGAGSLGMPWPSITPLQGAQP